MVEVVRRFGITPRRRELLRGLLRYRAELRRVGVVGAFQWLDGSFVENLPHEPNDLDVVTFAEQVPSQSSLTPGDLYLFQADWARADFGCDAYFVPLVAPDRTRTIERAVYWFGLFSHRRGTHQWKGLVQVGLDEARQDVEGLAELDLLDMQGVRSHEH